MRNWLKTVVLLTVLTVFIFADLNIYATDYADTLRVGIYYDSTTVKSLEIGSDTGFAIGLFKDRKFIPVTEDKGNVVYAELDRAGGEQAYYVSYSRHNAPEEAAEANETLHSQGMDTFIAYINSEYHVVGGEYKNNNDASWAAENLAVKGEVISLSEKAIRLKNNDGKIVFVVDDGLLGLSVYSAKWQDSDAILSISGSAKGTYRGGFECKSLDGESITVVNTVPVEAYLYSVVCREMSPSWEVEALKAQAVCARNFALGRLNYHKKYGFDVCRTVCCQAYATTADNSQSVHTAVDETKGELLFYEDSLVQAVYSSSMGKRTESVENVWGSKFPYLVSVENPYEDTENIYNGKWTKTLTKTRATEIMNARGYDIGAVTDIIVLERTPADSVLKLKVQGTKGDKVFERESCRGIFSEVTYSQRYTVSQGGKTEYPVLCVSDGKSTVKQSSNTFAVISGDKTVSAISGECTAYNGKTKKLYQTSSSDGDANTFVFDGEGWGHGVGMSQYGAKGMAMAGFDYEEILTHYYTGTHIERAY